MCIRDSFGNFPSPQDGSGEERAALSAEEAFGHEVGHNGLERGRVHAVAPGGALEGVEALGQLVGADSRLGQHDAHELGALLPPRALEDVYKRQRLGSSFS